MSLTKINDILGISMMCIQSSFSIFLWGWEFWIQWTMLKA